MSYCHDAMILGAGSGTSVPYHQYSSSVALESMDDTDARR
jgi:hypothetical protein